LRSNWPSQELAPQQVMVRKLLLRGSPPPDPRTAGQAVANAGTAVVDGVGIPLIGLDDLIETKRGHRSPRRNQKAATSLDVLSHPLNRSRSATGKYCERSSPSSRVTRAAISAPRPALPSNQAA
jgi:hypothetical protein